MKFSGRLFFQERGVWGNQIQWYLKMENWPSLGEWSHRQQVRNGLCTEEAQDFPSDQSSYNLVLKRHRILANSALLGRKKEETSANSRAVETLWSSSQASLAENPKCWCFSWLWSCTVTHQQFPSKADIAFPRLLSLAVLCCAG